MTEADLIDYEHCPTCHEALTPVGLPLPLESCGLPWAPTREDVQPVRCRLPLGHRSTEHWHPALWPGTESVVWFTDE